MNKQYDWKLPEDLSPYMTNKSETSKPCRVTLEDSGGTPLYIFQLPKGIHITSLADRLIKDQNIRFDDCLYTYENGFPVIEITRNRNRLFVFRLTYLI